jgi:hypothetical protein
LQAVAGVHAQQRGVGLGEQVAVGQLHQQRRRAGSRWIRWARRSPKAITGMDGWRDYAGARRKETWNRRSSQLRTTANSWPRPGSGSTIHRGTG